MNRTAATMTMSIEVSAAPASPASQTSASSSDNSNGVVCVLVGGRLVDGNRLVCCGVLGGLRTLYSLSTPVSTLLRHVSILPRDVHSTPLTNPDTR